MSLIDKLKFWKKDKETTPSEKKEEKPSKPKLKKPWRITLLVLMWVFAFTPLFIIWSVLNAQAEDLPDFEVLENPPELQASIVYSSDDKEMGRYYLGANRKSVNYKQISPNIISALISTEDERFYVHPGIDGRAIVRAISGMLSGAEKGGASTLTQQLAKQLFTLDLDGDGVKESGAAKTKTDRLYQKLKENILAARLERIYTKEQIITMYLNQFDFLNNAVGIASAARVYFNTTADSLSMDQAALLIGMCQNPSKYNPLRFEEKAKKRREIVLNQWWKNSEGGNEHIPVKITRAQYDSLKELPLGLDYQVVDHKKGMAPYFREVLRDDLIEMMAEKLPKAGLSSNSMLKSYPSYEKFDKLLSPEEAKRLKNDLEFKKGFINDILGVLSPSESIETNAENLFEAIDKVNDEWSDKKSQREYKEGSWIQKRFSRLAINEAHYLKSQGDFDFSDFKHEIKEALYKSGFMRWTRKLLYTGGLRIFTTIDSRLQEKAEYAVERHLTFLQEKFDENNAKMKRPPFDNKVSDEEIENMMMSAIYRSARYKNARKNGKSQTSIVESFKNDKVKMKVFSWKGDRDTTMTPWDSIVYYKGFLQVGMMSMDPTTGFIKAWVGGPNFNHFAYDHVKYSKRQVGSTIKPFVYAAAMELGAIDPCSEFANIEYCIDIQAGTNRWKSWCPSAAGARLDGVMIPVKCALAGSMNPITVKIMDMMGAESGNAAGPRTMAKIMRGLGIELRQEDVVPAMCLGPMSISLYQMLSAQSSFVNKGVYNKPVTILRVEDGNGNVVVEMEPEIKEIMEEQLAYKVITLMKGVVSGVTNPYNGKHYGTAGGLRSRSRDYGKIKAPTAGKTGTTQRASDGWFIGLTPELATGVWVGAEDPAVHFRNMTYGQGGRMAMPIYGYYMQKVYDDKKLDISTKDFEAPQGFDMSIFRCVKGEADPFQNDFENQGDGF